jgi:tetratricopeptide (TPR) repeat protein
MKKLSILVAALSIGACSGGTSTSNGAATSSEIAKPPASAALESPEAIDHYNKGLALFDNVRTAEAAEEFGAALKAAPDFVLAHAFHGFVTPGPEGLKEIEQAASAASTLPEANRAQVESLLANRRGETAKAIELLTRVAQLTPMDWRAHYALGQSLLNNLQYDAAAKELSRATELNPNAGPALNSLGYAALRQGNAEQAVVAFQKYATVMPQEPNAQDSLAEALMAAGRFRESEAAFHKALELSPQFWNALEGIAYTKFYTGNWAAGQDALGKARDAAPRRTDKLGVQQEIAFVALAHGNAADAQATLNAMEKTADVQPTDIALVPVWRAQVLIEGGKYPEALAEIATALQRVDAGQYPPGPTSNVRRQGLQTRVTAEARMGDKAAAQTTATALQKEATDRPGDAAAQIAMHYALGMLAVAQDDPASAKSHLSQCAGEDDYCGWQLLLASQKAGDAAGTSATKKQLLRLYKRDPLHLYLRSRIVAKGAKQTTH